jgi:hypothetical protein
LTIKAPDMLRIYLPRLHARQRDIADGARRFNVLVLGRRWGKNVLLRDRAVGAMLAGRSVGWFAPSYRMLLDDWDALETLLKPLISRLNVQERRIQIVTGGSVDFWSLENRDAARGRKYHLAVINEAAFAPRLATAWAEVIRPTLADYQGGAWLAGTPKGMNDYYAIYQAATGDDWARWQGATEQNPYIAPAEIEAMHASMPERAYQQEILAQFLEDGAGVFRRVQAAATARQADPVPGAEYVIGVDWARTEDATVFCVLDAQAGRQVALDRMSNTDYATQRQRLAALCARYNPRVVLAEYNSMGGPMVEALQGMGLPVQPFTTSNATKAQIIDGLALAFERCEVAIIDDEVQVGELLAYASERLPSGMVRYSAPDGMHDDTVMALALAWHAARGGAGWLIS